MKGSFRQSMAWLHTWSGLVVGWLLFSIFLTGTASFFRQEISLWMRPELRQSAAAPDAAAIALGRLQTLSPDARQWAVDMPDVRDPVTHIYVWRDRGKNPEFQREALDAATGEPIVARATYGGDFLYYFHFDLNMPSIWGRLIVGAATIIMLAAIVSGVITHRRIFRDFFTFRPLAASPRSWLDAHNVLAVLALPFHLMISYTGLITLMFLYMPWGIDAAYEGDHQAFQSEASISTRVPQAANVPAPLMAIEPLIEEASRRWGGGSIGRIDVYRPGDANALITLTSSDSEQVSHYRRRITFNGVTGEVVAATDDHSWAADARGVLYGLHLGRFADPFLRWLYFLSGMAGTAMVATGLVLWVVKRRPRRNGSAKTSFGHRLVEALNVSAIVGLPIAIALFFWANRLLPVELAQRADWEVGCFFAAWALTAVHSTLRPPWRAWTEQLWTAALAFVGLPILNYLTTSSSHLGVTVPQGYWALAGFDLAMLAFGLAFVCAAWIVAHWTRVTDKTGREPWSSDSAIKRVGPAE